MESRSTGLKTALTALVALILVSGCIVRKDSGDIGITGDYMGQPRPGMTAELFAESIVSTGLHERDGVFSPDGREFYFTIMLPSRTGVIMVMREKENRWTQPQVAPFSGTYSDVEPFIAPGGKRLYFASNRPLETDGEAKDYDIWFVDRTDTGWTAPQNVGLPINTEKGEFYPSVARDGTIYFTADYDGQEDIYVSRLKDGRFSPPEKLGETVNTKLLEFNALVAPDESFLVFSSVGREDGLGGGDLYVSFQGADGTWTEAVNMGEGINSSALDYCPVLSPDGRYLFFTSLRRTPVTDSEPLRFYRDVRALHNRVQNGNGDLYWVDSRILDSLRTR